MKRYAYKIFSEGRIANLTLKNRLVRSATANLAYIRSVTDEILAVYQSLAEGGVGMIITGEFPVGEKPTIDADGRYVYKERWFEGIEKIAEVIHRSDSDCKIVAQVGGEMMGVISSSFPTRFPSKKRPISKDEIRQIEECFVVNIARLKNAGFDGVQLHGAHGNYFLNSFLSPYMNRRTDEYGGSVENRARIIREIVTHAREKVGDFPILIKANGTDHMPGGTDFDTFAAMAGELESIGVDAIEISGGIQECLARSKEDLGFRPVFQAASCHTGIKNPDEQSYYLKYAEAIDINIPVILVGGNRDIERLEAIIEGGKVDFVSLCRPLIAEPDLPNRWMDGRGSSGTDCVSCNSCFLALRTQSGGTPQNPTTCLYKHDKEQYRAAQVRINSWVQENLVD